MAGAQERLPIWAANESWRAERQVDSALPAPSAQPPPMAPRRLQPFRMPGFRPDAVAASAGGLTAAEAALHSLAVNKWFYVTSAKPKSFPRGPEGPPPPLDLFLT